MKQTTIFDFLDDLSETLEAIENAEQTDETPDDADEAEAVNSTLIESLITQRLSMHITKGTFPSLDEVKSILILDQINRQYNA